MRCAKRLANFISIAELDMNGGYQPRFDVELKEELVILVGDDRISKNHFSLTISQN